MVKTKNSQFRVLIFCILFIVMASVASTNVLKAVIFTEHAKTSHPRAISEIINCFDGNGTIFGPFTGDNGRWVEFCNDGGPNNFFRVFQCSGEDKIIITQFKQAINRLTNYMINKNMVPGEAAC